MRVPTSKVTKVHVAGPLGPFAGAYEAKLRGRGYTPLSAVNRLREVALLSRWLDERQMGVTALTHAVIDDFLDCQRSRPVAVGISRQGLLAMVEVLDEQGVERPVEPRACLAPDDELVVAFERFLVRERALLPATAAAYGFRARRFLAGCAPATEIADLCAKDVTDAIIAESASVSVGATQYFVVAIRSFLRFCFIEGLVAVDISAAALSSTGRRHSPLPQGISAKAATALLRSCDRRTDEGKREFAILLVLIRLGLRASEVAGLRLDDIDWRAGEILIRGKGRREDRLPLPNDVGEAIAAYLQGGRSRTGHREVFLRWVAPAGPLGRGGVGSAVRRACRRAGVAEVGPHRLRHTLATEMVRAGASLPEVGQLLRHRGISSPSIYARVDVEGLRQIAQPWPGAAL